MRPRCSAERLLGIVFFATWLAATGADARSPKAPELTRAPELVTFVEAEYPESEFESGRDAVVGLRLLIDETGRVQEVEVVESAGAAFDEAAAEAARQFVFTPAEVDGKVSSIRILYRYAFAWESPALPPVAATLEGQVRRRGTKMPLADVEVTLAGEHLDGVATTRTDDQGRFSFQDVPPGRVSIGFSGGGITAVQTVETLEAGQRLDVAYDVSLAPLPADDDDADDLEIVVVAPAIERQVVSTVVDAEQARRVPGTSGDVVRVVESLPGVGRATAGSGALVVWGAAPQDTRIYVDGVPIPRLYHEGGLRSVIHPYFVDSVELTPGGYGAAWGRGLGGLVSVSSRTRETEGIHGRLHADILDGSAVLGGPIGKRKRLHVAAGARASYLKLWADQLVDPEVAELVPIPRYGDGQVRALWRPSSTHSLELVGLTASNRFARGVPDPDPALRTRDARRLDFYRVYARYVNDSGQGRVLTLTPFGGWTGQRQETRFGNVATSLENRAALAGVRADYAARVKDWFSIRFGVDAEVDVVTLDRVGALALPAREGDVRVFGQPPPDQIGADTWSVVQVGVAPYTEAELSFWDGRFRVVPGLRLDPYARSISRRNPPDATAPAVGAFVQDVALEPRLALVGRPHQRVELRTAVGMYRQSPAPEDLSAAFGNPFLPTARAVHTVLGGSVAITKTTSVDVTGFYTQSESIAMRSPAASPLRARALEPIGRGRSYGMQTMLRQELFRGLFGWVAYTLMRAERQDRPDGPSRLFDFDQTHVLTAVLAYALPRGFETSARFRYASGFPRTPVEGAFFDAGRNLYTPLFGTQNSIRLPGFVQLDLRAAKAFEIRGTTLEVFLEVLNVWNQRNAEEFVFSSDYQQRDVIRGFPVLPVFGLQWDF